MASITLHPTTSDAQAATRQTPCGPSNYTAAGCHAPAAPAGVTLTHDTLMVRFATGYRAVSLASAAFPDGVRLISAFVDGRDGPALARITDYGVAVGYAIEIKSASAPGLWHTVTATRCTCWGFSQHHHCYHQSAARQAEAIILKLRFAERARTSIALAMRRAAFVAAFDEGVA